MTLVHNLMRLVTSHVQSQAKQRHLMALLPLFSTLMMGPVSPGALKLPADPELVGGLLLHLTAYTGPDGIHPRVLKELADIITGHLNNLSTLLGIWRCPSQLEAGKCCPSFQEG